jgi:uncharacterized membrane protein
MFDTTIGRIALILIFLCSCGALIFIIGTMMDSHIGRVMLTTLFFIFIAAFLIWFLWWAAGSIQEEYCEQHSPNTIDARIACRDKYGW